MFFSVARLRLSIPSALILLHSFAHAHENTIFTSSVSYCSPPESILIQQFDVAYIEKNTSVSFNISAASVLPNINVTANLYLNVYGMQPVNISLDLCSVLGGALCPLPTYNFTGSDSIHLPPSINVASHLPGIAYVIPDLEAFAQLTLTDAQTGKVRACIQSTLSNGWSTRQKGVEWATGGIALAALASAFAQSHIPGALAPVRLLDLLYLFQTIASAGLLGLNYPSVFRAYTINFSWALGLFITSPSSSIQRSINNMRRLTGGTVTDADDGGNPISLVNRKLSPFNVPSRLALGSPGTSDPQILAAVATVTDESSNVLQAGIPIYVNTIGIATANAFMTVFLTWLVFIAIVLATLALGFAIVMAVGHASWSKRNQETYRNVVVAYPSWARAWGIRASLVSLFPILIFVFWQWTLKDSWLSILLSVITLLAISALLLPAFYFVFHRSNGFKEDISSRTLDPIVANYRSQRIYTPYLFVVAILAKAMITSFGHAHGLLQAILVLIVETLLLLSLVFLRPHNTRGADVLGIFLAIIRMVCAGLPIAFVVSIDVQAIPRVVVGIITAVIYSVTVVIMFLDMLVNAGVWRLLTYAVCYGRRRSGHPLSSKTSSDNLESGESQDKDSEKQIGVFVTPASSYIFSRPSNPSPTHTPTTISDSSPLPSPLSPESLRPSVLSYSTASSTLGELLPHTYPFHHSRPPSGSTTSAISPSIGTFSVSASPVTPSSALATPRHHALPTPVEGHFGDEART